MTEAKLNASIELREAALKYASASRACGLVHGWEREKMKTGDELEVAAMRFSFAVCAEEGNNRPG